MSENVLIQQMREIRWKEEKEKEDWRGLKGVAGSKELYFDLVITKYLYMLQFYNLSGVCVYVYADRSDARACM